MASAHPGDLLRGAAEHHAAEAADGFRVAPLVGGAEGLGGVLDERDLVAGADLDDGVHVRRLAVGVDGDDGLGLGAPADAVGEGLLQQGRVQVPGAGLAVHENGGGARVGDGEGAAREGGRGVPVDGRLTRLPLVR